jgi:2-dehydropantoate 2-reductase
MRVVVVGTGGIGGYFAAKLAKAGADVTCVARGAHLAAIQNRGLRVRSAVEGEWTVPLRATAILSDLAVADLVLICVKSFDTEAAANLSKPVIGPKTAILSLQNGIDNESKLGSILGVDHVLGGIAYIFSNIESPGVIVHHQLGRIVFGELIKTASDRTADILDLFQTSGIPAELSPNVRKVLWDKYVFQTALGGTTAITRLPVRYVQEVKEIRSLWELQIEELLTIANAASVGFDENTITRYVSFLESLSPTNYSSIYQDLINGRRLELAAFHGHALQLGAHYQLPTPTIFAIHAALIGHANGRASA